MSSKDIDEKMNNVERWFFDKIDKIDKTPD